MWPNPQETADSVAFTKEILNRKLIFLRNVHTNINIFLASVPILYLLKTTENQNFSSVFRGYEMRKLARNGLSMLN